ncbi:unnamed protein product [Rotaria magnacalcarata]|uniref:Uncharacterized protein n=2 Tax=Rotaria magnacalcarata TaxID=392030 RepID=A0A819NCA6_9BILA|nr:unnamed protein product [Rotaria magnacalcarata]CAF1366744.1 unnamed protein product [Rotaria magnacalcarata]CAF2036462.1 unnamed protein product [Rotaria magnacalcarata]CAF2256869.1 unnamed protein product [Rotaria magnacalcarata]CAF3922008.1 unnamed protein product [Rotaria magnacalcarata]
MLDTFVMAYNELPSVLNTTQKRHHLKINYVELKQLTKYLKYFHDVIVKLDCERMSAIRLVVTYKQLLLNRSSKNDDDYLDLVELKCYISKHLNNYWIIHYIGMLLHPSLKSFQLISDEKTACYCINEIANNKHKNKVRKTTQSTNTLDEIFDVPDNEDNIQ